MTTAQWYRVLLEQEVTMVQVDANTREFIKSRAELLSPNTDWELSWRRARLKGLGSEATSFLRNLLHRLMPTEQRLARILPNSSDQCKTFPFTVLTDLEHCFLNCVSTKDVGSSLLNPIRQYDAEVLPSNLLKLEFVADGAQEMPLVWVAAQTLLYLWSCRTKGKIADLFITR